MSVSRTRGAARRDLLPIDPNRAGIRSPSAKGISLFLSVVALPGETRDFFLKDLLSQKAGHLCVMLNQVELRVDRSVESFSKRPRAVGVSSSLLLC